MAQTSLRGKKAQNNVIKKEIKNQLNILHMCYNNVQYELIIWGLFSLLI